MNMVQIVRSGSTSDPIGDGARRPHGHLALMDFSFVLLDDQWRPVRRIESGRDWRKIISELLNRDGQWILIEQQRAQEAFPHPRWTDIRLTRALVRHLRPLDLLIADHVIHGRRSRFSFRSAGLL